MKRCNKLRGFEKERELCHIFIDNNYRVVRIAASGCLTNADCDVVAANKKAAYCIEAKSTIKLSISIKKESMKKFIKFAEDTNFIPVIALRFKREDWIFINPDQLDYSGVTASIGLQRAKREGKHFKEYFK